LIERLVKQYKKQVKREKSTKSPTEALRVWFRIVEPPGKSLEI